MRSHFRRGELALGLALVSTLLITGCNQGPQAGTKPENYIFYPDPPDPPRIQFLTSFSSVKGWKQRSNTSFSKFILGTETERTVGAGAILSPYGVAARDGKIYICDLGRNCVHVVDVANDSYYRLGENAQMTQPITIYIAPDGTKYVCDSRGKRIVVFDAQDKFVKYLSNPATCTPLSCVVVGKELFVVDSAGAEVEAWDLNGKYLRTVVHKGSGVDQVSMPAGIAADSAGRLYVSDLLKSIVNVYDRQGQYLDSIGGPGDRPGYFARPKGMAIDPMDDLYVVDSQWDTAQIFNYKLRALFLAFGGPRPGPNGLGNPAGVCADPTSVKAFREFLSPDFEAQYIVVVTNQFGNNKVVVFAYGKSKTAKYPAIPSKPPSHAKTRPATTQPAGAATP